MLLVVYGLALTISDQAQPADAVSPQELYRPVDDHLPHIGVDTTVSLGDRMLLQRTGQFEQCVVPLFDDERRANLGVARVGVRRGTPLCQRAAGERNLAVPYDNWIAGGNVTSYDFVLRDRPNGQLQLCLRVMGVTSTCFRERPASDFQVGPYFVTAPNTLQQSIEYSGRNGSTLRFTYSETTGGLARDAFTREFQMDLNEGSTVAFRGAILEVSNASNTSISYRVVRNFQQGR